MINVLVTLVILWAGAAWSGAPGIFIGISATTVACLFQTGWMWWCSLPFVRQLEVRDRG